MPEYERNAGTKAAVTNMTLSLARMLITQRSEVQILPRYNESPCQMFCWRHGRRWGRAGLKVRESGVGSLGTGPSDPPPFLSIMPAPVGNAVEVFWR
jgi:hypothetical protein